MAHSGLGYYYNKAGLSSGDLNFWFNFNYSGNTNAQLGSGGLSFNGSTGQIWSSIGSGLFSGQSATITGNIPINNELSAIIIYSKPVTGNCVLFSSLESGSSISGFSVCINDANKVQIAAYDIENSSLVVNTCPFSLSQGNCLVISKADNIFSLGKFNFAEKEINYKTYTFPDGCNTSGNTINLASGSWFPSTTNFNSFTGYIDEFLLINRTITETSSSEILKSFYKYEPVSTFSIINEDDSYSYSNLNTITNPIWEEMQSGALDYINTNIFNKTGVGSIRVTSSGTIVNGTAYVSGSLSGEVSLQTGYYRSVTGSGVTGYSSSGTIVTASGITGYVDIDLFPITVFNSGDIYQLSAQSGIVGPTAWQNVFTDPLYGTIVTQELITGSETSAVSTNFSFTIPDLIPISGSFLSLEDGSGFLLGEGSSLFVLEGEESSSSGDATYVHIANYTNNGSDNIVIAHDLSYSSTSGSFRAFKTTQILYSSLTVESSDDVNFKNLFKYDGAIMVNPIQSGDLLDLYDISASGTSLTNSSLYSDLASGLFYIDTNDTIRDSDLLFYFNGVYQNKNDLLSGTYSGSGYFIKSNILNTQILADRQDIGVADIVSNVNTVKKVLINYNMNSGDILFTDLLSQANAFNHLVFLNGVKLCPIVDYDYVFSSRGSIRCINNNFSGVSGILSLVSNSGSGDLSISRKSYSYDNSITGNIYENNSLLFLNRLKQKIGVDYLEISSLDLIYGLTGFYESNLEEIFI